MMTAKLPDGVEGVIGGLYAVLFPSTSTSNLNGKSAPRHPMHPRVHCRNLRKRFLQGHVLCSRNPRFIPRPALLYTCNDPACVAASCRGYTRATLYSSTGKLTQNEHISATAAATSTMTGRNLGARALRLQANAIASRDAVHRFNKLVSSCISCSETHAAAALTSLHLGWCAPHGWGTHNILLWAGFFGALSPKSHEHRT